MVRCSQCVLSDATPEIEFDAAGVCNYCRSYQEFQYGGEPALLRILDAHRNPTAQYDCMVTISGGRDSTYTLWKLAVDYGMRVLAVNYQNPFTTPEGKENIANAVNSLGVDLIQFGFPDRLHERSLRHFLSAWLAKPSVAMVPTVCVACKSIWSVIPGISRKHGVSLIVSGGNPLEYTAFKKSALGASGDLSSDEDIEKSYDRVILGLLRQASGNLAYLHPRYLPLAVRGYLFAAPYSIGARILGRGLRRLDLFHFIEWEEDHIISTITSEMGWNQRVDGPSTWRTDCAVSCLKDAMYVQTMGMTEKDDFYSKMVRQGQMTRQEGLERVAKEGVLEWDMIEGVLREVGMEDALEPLGGS